MLALVIPYYKYDFFEATLHSLASQTNKQFHVYIGDDASTIPPNDLLLKYQGQFSFSYHRFPTNLGGISLVQQWDRCLELVENETWVQILGDDDTLAPNAVASFYEHLEAIEKEKCAVIRFATQVINENDVPISVIYQHPQLETAIDFLIRKFKGGTRSSLSEYIFKKEKVDSIKFKDFPLAWSTDTLAVIEFSESRNIYTINEVLVFFRRSGKNITSQSDSIEKNTAWFQFYYYVLSKYGKKYPNFLIDSLFDKLEKTQFNNKKTPFRWIKLFWLYLTFAKYSRFFSLSSKIKKSIQ
ncbi:glycosyltransferase [Flavobacterium limnosediminis]|uniref:glycosyltransferase n=1 Tax=Flavobacterium limnosediminis TaxID=1401027 RepID=UPI00040036ED|nr:glycosyltransferase [Flavobacterium limnosediminis]